MVTIKSDCCGSDGDDDGDGDGCIQRIVNSFYCSYAIKVFFAYFFLVLDCNPVKSHLDDIDGGARNYYLDINQKSNDVSIQGVSWHFNGKHITRIDRS